MTLTWRTVDLQRTDYSLWLDVDEGADEMPGFRGGDLVVPSRPGRVPYDRVADKLPIVLTGWIRGTGATVEDRVASYWSIWTELRTLCNPRIAAGDLVWGRDDGETLTASARGVNIMPGRRATAARMVSVELEAVDPPWWTIDGDPDVPWIEVIP
jgi:hypothetical protein